MILRKTTLHLLHCVRNNTLWVRLNLVIKFHGPQFQHWLFSCQAIELITHVNGRLTLVYLLVCWQWGLCLYTLSVFLIGKGRFELLDESIGVFSPVYPSGHAPQFTPYPPADTAWLLLEAAVRGHHHKLLSEKAILHMCDILWVETAATPTGLVMGIDTQED